VALVEVNEVGGGVYRVTHPLPFPLDHVHTYAISGPDGWTVVDTGLAANAEARWAEALERLGRPKVTRIVVTHYHPDHVGGTEALRRLTGAAEILQNRRDAELCHHAFARPESAAELRRYFTVLGMPPATVEQSLSGERGVAFAPPEPTSFLEEGDVLELASDVFEVLHLPGHADGHIALLGRRTGRMFGADVILRRITPNVATWHHTDPDPLARYLATLDRLEELRPAVVLPGHYADLPDAAGRAAEIREHHRVRLDVHHEVLRAGAVTPWEVSRRVWDGNLTLHELRFALLEAVSHLVRLERVGRARELAPGRWHAL
jgi:glyoxylase-like metal-dependent hydrolase (beta-lactamase superfamily II)